MNLPTRGKKPLNAEALKVPACGDCNEKFGELENEVKQAFFLIRSGQNFVSYTSQLLDWFDKTRTALWLYMVGLEAELTEQSFEPKFFAGTVAGYDDRFLAMARLPNRTTPRLEFFGQGFRGFAHCPVAMCLIYRDIIFISVQGSWNICRQFGLKPSYVRKWTEDFHPEMEFSCHDRLTPPHFAPVDSYMRTILVDAVTTPLRHHGISGIYLADGAGQLERRPQHVSLPLDFTFEDEAAMVASAKLATARYILDLLKTALDTPGAARHNQLSFGMAVSELKSEIARYKFQLLVHHKPASLFTPIITAAAGSARAAPRPKQSGTPHSPSFALGK